MALTIFVGPVIYATNDEPMVVMPKAAIGVNNSKIEFLDDSPKLESLSEKYKTANIVYLSDGEFLMPGLIDTHIHAPQMPNAGIGYDVPLLQWLEKYTFPTEAKFSDVSYATEVYKIVVRRLLECGTTTALYHATIHPDSTQALGDICEEFGQRALVGKVCVDQESPEYLTESTQDSLEDTRRYIEDALKKNRSLVSPCIIPRFAISCSNTLMTGLAQLAQEFNVHIQSHMCENREEVALVRMRNPTARDYADVYDSCGVLDAESSMAHCVYVDERQMKVMSRKHVAVSHCPNSNMSLKSGLCDVRTLLDNDIKVGLGTDVSGGYNVSILDAIRMACQTSNILGLDKEKSSYKYIDYKEAFRMATLGGSQVLRLDDKIGSFEVGKEFDALRINTKVKGSPCIIFEKDSLIDTVQKFLFTGDDRNIVSVYVAGKQVINKL